MVGMTATPDRTDRRDIFELFGYNKIYEVPLHQAIEEGHLVPFIYYGLTDNVDYSKIRFQNQRYRVDDLERHLIILERNEAVIREYLEKGEGDKAIRDVKESGRRQRKIEYEYSTGCEVHFDAEVEEILNRQDAKELGVTKEDLKEAYFALAETLGRKPSRDDLNEHSEYKSAVYMRIFGSWVKFLREVGEYTEASYHYPQGTHIGHILSLLSIFGAGQRDETHLNDEYIRLRGGLGKGRLSTYRRQVKYKLQAAMELGILTDDRNYPEDAEYVLDLTPRGRELYSSLEPLLNQIDLEFPRGDDGIPSTRMRMSEADFNFSIRQFTNENHQARNLFFRVFLNMHAVQQMLAFLYHICRSRTVHRNECP